MPLVFELYLCSLDHRQPQLDLRSLDHGQLQLDLNSVVYRLHHVLQVDSAALLDHVYPYHDVQDILCCAPA